VLNPGTSEDISNLPNPLLRTIQLVKHHHLAKKELTQNKMYYLGETYPEHLSAPLLRRKQENA
jgi:hypothetical protein